MKKGLFILLIFCFSLNVFSCSVFIEESSETGNSDNTTTTIDSTDNTTESGTFLVVGLSGTILTSSDGSTWTSRTSGTSITLYSITYANSNFVIVGDSGKVL
tara:strand:+ start:237 stop:542 length:306 start_codon:yes stop_codon:yes gene_type:complete